MDCRHYSSHWYPEVGILNESETLMKISKRITIRQPRIQVSPTVVLFLPKNVLRYMNLLPAFNNWEIFLYEPWLLVYSEKF